MPCDRYSCFQGFQLSSLTLGFFAFPIVIEHLYIHIPFCPNICPYCAFYKESAGRERVETFLDALLVDVGNWAPQLRPKTIFFGGGTPSALSLPQFEKLLGGLRERLDLSDLEEWTIEMNPATVALDKRRTSSTPTETMSATTATTRQVRSSFQPTT